MSDFVELEPIPSLIEFVILVRTENPLNLHTGNSRLAAIIRTQRRAKHRHAARVRTLAALRTAGVSAADMVPCTVTLTRLSAGKMDDDGLASSQKGIRDGIAAALGVDDGGPAISFVYGQERSKRGMFGVRVTVERRPTS